MKVLSLIIQIVLFVAFAMAGLMKLITPFEEMKETMPWVADFEDFHILLIGLLELLGAVGLILPALLRKFRFLIPAAAAGLLLTMVGAILTHITRGETVIPNLILTALLLFVFFVQVKILKNEG